VGVAVDALWPDWRDRRAEGSWPDERSWELLDTIAESCAAGAAWAAEALDDSSGLSDEEAKRAIGEALETRGLVASEAMLDCAVAGLRRDLPGSLDGSATDPVTPAEIDVMSAILEWCFQVTA
jgi:hypothetical protein